MSNAKVVYDILKMVSPTPAYALNHTYDSTGETLTRLKFIGLIEPGEKVDIRNLRIESNTLFTPLKRLFYGEGREMTYSFTQQTIERSFAILYTLASTDKLSDQMLCSNILTDMHSAINGLNNMKQTYDDDKMFRCNIDILIQTIQAKMLEVKMKYPSIWNIFEETHQNLQQKEIICDEISKLSLN
jgi:hypothetical protein